MTPFEPKRQKQVKLGKFLIEEKEEIFSSWTKQIKALGGSFSLVSNSELQGLNAEFMDAFIEILEKGNFLKCRLFIEKISQLRSAQGFRLSEVQRAYFSFSTVIEPLIEKLEDEEKIEKGTLNTVNNILWDTLFELSEAYYKRLNEKIERYIEEIEKANLSLKETSIKDALTGCYNHRYFQDVMTSEIFRGKRYNRPIAIVMFDIDHFKKFNDKYGHPFGDELLKGIGNILMKSVRNSDVVFRYGGEEFVIILTETKKDKAFIIAERIRKKISDLSFDIKGKRVKITISGGVDGFNRKYGPKEDLIASADKALYLAKKRGRNQIVLYGKKGED